MSDTQAAVRMFRELTAAAAVSLAHGDRALSVEGFSVARWHVLESFAETPLTVSAVARAMRLSRQSVQRIADLLVDDGHLERLPNPSHRAAPLLAATEQGRAKLLRLRASVADWDVYAMTHMTPDGVEQLTRLLCRLREVGESYDGRGLTAGETQ